MQVYVVDGGATAWDRTSVDQPRDLDHVTVRRDPARFGLSIEDGELSIEGVPLKRVAAEVQTPVYVYGAGHIRSQFQGLARALEGRPVTICYAMKANSNLAVVRLLASLGAGADIVSGGELARALAAGVDPSKIVFSGVGKTDAEIDAAIDATIRSINVESAEEISRIASRARAKGAKAPLSLRINPDVDPDTHPYLATGLREAKFGIPMADGARLAREVAADEHLELVGLACHIGSQIMGPTPFIDSIDRLRAMIDELAADDIQMRHLDIGGGLGIPYQQGDDVVDVQAWGRAVVEATRDLDMDLVLEPGRYLVGNAGVLVTEVLGRKRGEEKSFVIVDAAMNDLVRPALYEAYHTVTPVKLADDSAEVRTVDVVGPVCESGDFISEGRAVPWPETGDLFAICSAGAYGMTMASNYNTRPRAAEVLVDGDRFAVIRKRETVEELLAADVVPAWLD